MKNKSAITLCGYRSKSYLSSEISLSFMQRHLLLFFFFICISGFSFSQLSIKDSVISTPLIMGNYAYHFPGGHLAERFGNSSSIGAAFLQKTKKHWLWGFDFNFIFGKNIREDSLFSNITTKNGFLINQHGALADIRLYERGLMGSIKIGRLFTVLGPNPNCGFVILGSAGFLQHKIRIENPGNNTPQVLGEYKKGYDKLTNGFAVSEFIGYMYLSNNRLINFFGGFEFIQSWTQNRRPLNFDTMEKDNIKRMDLLSGFKIGWIIPLYKKVPDKYYFY